MVSDNVCCDSCVRVLYISEQHFSSIRDEKNVQASEFDNAGTETATNIRCLSLPYTNEQSCLMRSDWLNYIQLI